MQILLSDCCAVLVIFRLLSNMLQLLSSAYCFPCRVCTGANRISRDDERKMCSVACCYAVIIENHDQFADYLILPPFLMPVGILGILEPRVTHSLEDNLQHYSSSQVSHLPTSQMWACFCRISSQKHMHCVWFNVYVQKIQHAHQTVCISQE